MDRISDSGSDDLGSNPGGVTSPPFSFANRLKARGKGGKKKRNIHSNFIFEPVSARIHSKFIHEEVRIRAKVVFTG